MSREKSMSMGAPQEQSMSMGDLERNKATAFHDLTLYQGRPAEAVQKYAGATYIQQNPLVDDGGPHDAGAQRNSTERDQPPESRSSCASQPCGQR